jgi:hypothetical protein
MLKAALYVVAANGQDIKGPWVSSKRKSSDLCEKPALEKKHCLLGRALPLLYYQRW